MSIIKNFYDNASKQVTLYPATRTSTVSGTDLDFNGLNDCIAFQFADGFSGSSPTLDGNVKETNDHLSYSTRTTFGRVTFGPDVQFSNFTKTQRYLQGNFIVGGSSPSLRSSIFIACASDLRNIHIHSVFDAAFVENIVTTNTNSPSNDLLGQIGPCVAIQIIGTVSGSSPTLDGKIQESDDLSNWFDVSSGAFTQVTSSNNLQTILFSRTRRYLRHVLTLGGGSPSFIVSSMLMQADDTDTITLSFSGTLNQSGSLTKQEQKLESDSLSESGSLVKNPTWGKSLSGSLTQSGSLIRQDQKVLSATLTESTNESNVSLPVFTKLENRIRGLNRGFR